jgi:hypothetical protein
MESLFQSSRVSYEADGQFEFGFVAAIVTAIAS